MFDKFSTELLEKINKLFLQDTDKFVDDDEVMDFAILLECELERRLPDKYWFS